MTSSLSVDTMRAVDYWAGVPLCALSTVLLRPFRRPRPQGAPRNVLLIELSEMGSAILVDPAMRAMKARGANLHFVIFAKNKASLDLLGTVPDGNIFVIRPDGVGSLLIDTARFLVWARKKRIDTVIDLELFSRYTALLTAWCGAARRVGYHRIACEGLYRGDLLTDRVMYNPYLHIARNFFSLVEAAWSDGTAFPPARLRVPDAVLELAKAEIPASDLAAVDALLRDRAGWDGRRPLVLVNANASDLLPQRRWARDRYAALITKILDHRPDALVLLTGAPSERDGLGELAALVNRPACINFAGVVAFRQLLPLYHRSHVMISNDSGPAHFASVTRMPTIVLFGPENPALYGSLGPGETVYAGLHCSPCVSAFNHRKTPCTDNTCLQAITVDEVFARTLRYLDAEPLA